MHAIHGSQQKLYSYEAESKQKDTSVCVQT